MNRVSEANLALELPIEDISGTRDFARRLGSIMKRGDLVVLTGELGAGKTTFTQGLGLGLGVREGIISPTFVISRIHPALGEGPDLVHVDAYRLSSAAELEDLDLEASMGESVTVVEWGAGKVEALSDSRLEIVLLRPGAVENHQELVFDFETGDDDEPRTIQLAAIGPRWVNDPALAQLLNDFTS